MSLQIFQLPALTDNYIYVVVCERTRQAAVVDPSEAAPVLDFLAGQGCELTAIWNTHHHPDHVGGNAGLLQVMPHLTVWGSAYDLERRRIPGQTQGLKEGDRLPLGQLSFAVWEIPGHTRGHLALLGPAQVFCGDTVFAAGCGRIFEGSFAELFASIQRFQTLPPECRLYCGHEYTQTNLEFALSLEPGEAAIEARYQAVCRKRKNGASTVPSTIAEEKACNPFFRLQSLAIREKIGLTGQGVSDLDVFIKLRKMKDHF